MIYEVELSEQADSDLREIFEYIAFELQSPENTSVNTTHKNNAIFDIFAIKDGILAPCD